MSEDIKMVLEIANKDSAMLAVIEALGRTIDELKRAVVEKDMRISALESDLAKVRGGSNKW